MVKAPNLYKVRQIALFIACLVGVGLGIAIMARFRVGLIALRVGFGLFNIGSVIYCLSLIGQSIWEKSGRLTDAFSGAHKESGNVECD
jgi:hypothetical protein